MPNVTAMVTLAPRVEGDADVTVNVEAAPSMEPADG
jgi:hypothetical protein